MVGPDMAGLGGISRVVSTWYSAGFFEGFRFSYIASATDNSVSRLLFSLRSIIGFVTKMMEFPDLIFIHTSGSKGFFRKSIFVLLAALFRRRIILHIHPTWFFDFVTSRKGISRIYCLFVLKQVHTFVVLTEEMKKKLPSLFPDTPIYLLRNAINFDSMANKENISRAENSLLYLGWYIKPKGVYELVDAMDMLKSENCAAHLDFFGTKEVPKLKEYVISKDLCEKVTVNGWIGDEEKINRLYVSTMLILPSHSEGIPNVILEAMATKTPILATSVGGMKELLRDRDNAMIVAVNDARDLSEKILLLLRDRELRNRIAENAYREAKEKYDVRVIKEQFIRIIEGVTK